MKHIGTQMLKTERLLLRKSDINDVDEYDDNIESQRTFFREQVMNEYNNLNFYFWTIVEKMSNKAVGYIRTIENNEKMLSCKMAYEIKEKYRNNGYASEALKRVLEFLLIEVEYNRISAGHLADNPASGRVMEKAGMKYEGTRRQDNRNREGRLIDSNIYAILRDDLLI